jgi:hypothetical protein
VSWQATWQRVLLPRHLVALRKNLGYGCWAAFLISHASFADWSTNCRSQHTEAEIPLRLLVIEDADHYEILSSGHIAWTKV